MSDPHTDPQTDPLHDPEFVVVPARLRALTGVDAIRGGEIRWGRVSPKES
ncbi:hypothetical protein AB0H98_30600 [Nocardia salmonicida]